MTAILVRFAVGGTDNVANGRGHCGGVSAEDSITTQGRVPKANGEPPEGADRRHAFGRYSPDLGKKLVRPTRP
jgi:hypothetical protein